MLGGAGTGKTHLAVAVGLKAIRNGQKVVYLTVNELLFCLKTQDNIKKSRLNKSLAYIYALNFVFCAKRWKYLLLRTSLYYNRSFLPYSNRAFLFRLYLDSFSPRFHRIWHNRFQSAGRVFTLPVLLFLQDLLIDAPFCNIAINTCL